jgi:haloalkane dehalogenase
MSTVQAPGAGCTARSVTWQKAMDYLRTDDRRFQGLPAYGFAPNYLAVDDTEGARLRMHYVDGGRRAHETVLCLHGEPTWCFLYRKMIGVFVEAGFRVIAPDLIGFGRSDKPTRRTDYTYQRHVDWVTSLVLQLGLSNVTLFCQDWGGLIGLRIVAEHEGRFRRVVTANTTLPTGERAPGEDFLHWRRLSQEMPVFPVGSLIDGACVNRLSDDVIAAYDAPFPDESYKAGARQFPILVPISADDPASGPNKRAWQSLEAFERPWLTVFSDKDPMTRKGEKVFQRRIKGAQGQPHVIVQDAGHFLQEDKGAEIAGIVVDFMNGT